MSLDSSPQKRARHDGEFHSNKDDTIHPQVVVAPSSNPTNNQAIIARAWLNNGIVACVVSFLDPIKAALINKAFLEAANQAAVTTLAKMESDYSTILSPQWKLQLGSFVWRNYERFYFSGTDHSHPMIPFPTLPPRLLLQAAVSLPVAQHVSPIIGPSTMLPNGNLVVVCQHDNCIRTLDKKEMTWTTYNNNNTVATLLDPARVPFPPVDAVAERMMELSPQLPGVELVAAVLQEGGISIMGQLLQNRGAISWITGRLSYSDGHLVLHHSPNAGQFVCQNWLHVWKLVGQGQDVRVQHLYTMDLKGNCLPAAQEHRHVLGIGDAAATLSSIEGVAVASDGVFYLIRETKETPHQGVSYTIQKFGVATGRCVTTKTIGMPQVPSGKGPKYTTINLFLSDDFLWFSRQVEEKGPFGGIGLGVYSFSRADLSQKCFLPCFEDGEIWINMPRHVQSTNQWMLAKRNDGSEESFRKISIDKAGVLVQSGQITFGSRNEVILVNDNRVLVEHSEEEEERGVRLDEYDITTGEKIRTLSTGVLRRRENIAMVASIHSNGTEMFCLFSNYSGNTDHVIQVFQD